MKDHWLAFFGIFVAVAIAVCAFAPWQDTDDATDSIRDRVGDSALTFAVDPENPALCDGIGVSKVPFGVRVSGPPCPRFLDGTQSYFVTFWGAVIPSNN